MILYEDILLHSPANHTLTLTHSNPLQKLLSDPSRLDFAYFQAHGNFELLATAPFELGPAEAHFGVIRQAFECGRRAIEGRYGFSPEVMPVRGPFVESSYLALAGLMGFRMAAVTGEFSANIFTKNYHNTQFGPLFITNTSQPLFCTNCSSISSKLTNFT